MRDCKILLLQSCSESITNDPSITCEDTGTGSRKKYILYNPNRFSLCKYKPDGCDYFREGMKCDFLIAASDSIRFVELKGGDIAHAARQILETWLKIKTIVENKKVHARIVATKISSPALQREDMKKLLKEFENRVVCKSGTLKEDLSKPLSNSCRPKDQD